jgi:hypothetical protein
MEITKLSVQKSPSETLKPMKFTVHLLLFFFTGTLWEVVYNLLCFSRLNQLAKVDLPESIPSTKNSVVLHTLLTMSILGTPYVWYRKFKLLREFIIGYTQEFGPLPTETNDEGEVIQPERLNCIEPLKYLGFALVAILIIGVVAGSTVILAIMLSRNAAGTLPNTIWGNGAYMIFFPIGIGSVLCGFGFCYRVALEEKNWIEAYNAIIAEIKERQ